jgi:hypothetical protein
VVGRLPAAIEIPESIFLEFINQMVRFRGLSSIVLLTIRSNVGMTVTRCAIESALSQISQTAIH